MTQQTKVLQKKGTLQIIRRVVPICQAIAYSFCFTGAETEIHKIKDNSKIIMLTNLDRRGLRPIPIICHCLDPPSFSLPTTFKLSQSINEKCCFSEFFLSLNRILLWRPISLKCTFNSLTITTDKQPTTQPSNRSTWHKLDHATI